MRFLLTACLVALFLTEPLTARDISLPDGPYISTSAEAEVEMTPDFATFDLSARFVEETPEAARERIDNLLEQVLDALVQFDSAIAEHRLRTLEFGKNREYDREERRFVPAGFFGSFALEVRISDFEQLNALQYRLAEFELGNLRGPFFQLTEAHRAELEHRARIQSIELATERAEELANAQGASLGSIWGIINEPMHANAGGDPGRSIDSSVGLARMAQAPPPPEEAFAIGFDLDPIRIRVRTGVVYELLPGLERSQP